MVALHEIVRLLNEQKIRATYGAVGAISGDVARNVGRRLGRRSMECSWVVNKKTGLPSGYLPGDLHPDLQRTLEVIDSPDELLRRLREQRR